jgi:hypothetical protein
MQFSLRWILIATAYVALAAAAFGTGEWYFADALWAASLLAAVYALLLAVFARGRRQMMAAGFALAAAGFLLWLQFGDAQNMPTFRLLNAAGIGQPAQPKITVGFGGPALYTVLPDGSVMTPPAPADMPDYLRAANSVGMLLFGLIGCFVGALAFRAATTPPATDH